MCANRIWVINAHHLSGYDIPSEPSLLEEAGCPNNAITHFYADATMGMVICNTWSGVYKVFECKIIENFPIAESNAIRTLDKVGRAKCLTHRVNDHPGGVLRKIYFRIDPLSPAGEKLRQHG